MAFAAIAAPAAAAKPAPEPPLDAGRVALGRQLYMDLRFTNPGTNVQSSCGGCHIPPGAARGERLYADFEPLSVIPHRADDNRRQTTRNTPTLLGVGAGVEAMIEAGKKSGADAAIGNGRGAGGGKQEQGREHEHEQEQEQERRLGDASLGLGFRHEAGPFESLEAMIATTLVGRLYGWTPAERADALDNMDAVVVGDTGEGRAADGAYADQFKALGAGFAADLAASTPEANLKAIAGAIADYVRSLRSTRTSPYDAFVEINRINRAPGAGETPAAYAQRVFGRLANQEARLLLKRPGGFSAEAFEGFKIFLRTEGARSVGACVTCHTPPDFSDWKFHDKGLGTGPARTPTLRGLARTDPYMADGAAKTIEVAVRAAMFATRADHGGRAPGADPAMAAVNITDADIAPLAAFLRALDDLDKTGFRESLVGVVNHIPAGKDMDEELDPAE